MTEFFIDAHSVWQYVTLIAVIGSLVWSYRDAVPSATKEKMYRLTAVVVDIQVALGIVIWLSGSGWRLGFMQGWLHPLVGLAALAVLHVSVGRARKAGHEGMDAVMRTGLVIVVALVVAAIGVAEIA